MVSIKMQNVKWIPLWWQERQLLSLSTQVTPSWSREPSYVFRLQNIFLSMYIPNSFMIDRWGYGQSPCDRCGRTFAIWYPLQESQWWEPRNASRVETGNLGRLYAISLNPLRHILDGGGKLTNSNKTGIGWGGLAAALLLFGVLFILFLIEHYTGVNTIPHCIAVQQPQTNICWLVGFFPSSHLYPYAKIIYFSLPLYPIQVYDD